MADRILSLYLSKLKQLTMQDLLDHIGSRCTLTPALSERIQSDFEEIHTQQGDHLLTQGMRAIRIYFVSKGVVHNYYYHNGKEITSWFYQEGFFVTSWHSFYAQRAGFESVQCLEDCTLYALSHAKYLQLIADFPAFGQFARVLAEETVSYLDYFSKSWAFLSAKEKYEVLHTHFPKIEQRVKLGQIASFLGISQETLSRIRGK